MRGNDEIERTVIIESEKLTKEKIETLNHVKTKYEEMLKYVLEFGSRNNITSSLRLKAKLYHELREKYPDLPSHYIHEVCRDASTRLESFKKKKKKGKTKTVKPEVKKVSIWLDDHLFKQTDDFTIRVSTHKGYTFIPIKPHKLYWKYKNNREWNRAGEVKVKLLDDKVLVYFTFNKEAVEPKDAPSVISVDVNENNITFKVDNKVYIVEHNIGKTVVSYSSYRQTVQSVKGNRHVSRTVSKNEKNKKKDRRRKIARLIVREAKSRGYSIAVEDLPKNVPSHMIERVNDKRLRNRIYQSGFMDVLHEIEEEAKKSGVKLVKVNPSYTSSTCPRCGGRLVRGSAQREVYCPHCGFRGNRDVVATINIDRKTQQGTMPLCPMPNDPTLEVVVLPMKVWVRSKSLEDALKYTKLTKGTL